MRTVFDSEWITARFALVVLIVIAVNFVGVSFANANISKKAIIENNELRIVFDEKSGSIRHWYLLNVSDAGGAYNLSQPEGRLFSLRGTLGGVNIKDWEKLVGGWAIYENEGNSLILRLIHPQNRFILEQIWTLVDDPWRARFELHIDTPQFEITPDDRLWLEIGPGIGETPAKGLGIAQSLYSFTEVVYQDNESVHHVRVDDEATTSTKQTKIGAADWIGLQSRYFALILNPQNKRTEKLQWTSFIPDDTARPYNQTIFDTSLRTELPLSSDLNKGKSLSYSWMIFGGGKIHEVLTTSEPDLSRLLFAGLWEWMRVITFAIMHVLTAIHAFIGNWGLSIIVLALVIRLLMHPLAKKTMLAQKKFVEVQERIQPELEEIKKNYKGAEQSERILQLYERHQVSPLAGLKPLSIVMLQIPVFVALFHLLGQVFELRNEPFLWIDTLAEPDKLFSFGIDVPFFGAYFNLLPVLMAVTTIASIKLSPAPAAGNKSSVRQNIMLTLMAIAFFLLFYSFPSGMVLYWAVANILQVMHQRLVGT